MATFVDVTCPYCGERAELDVDGDGARRQCYVQDCPVCCQPWQVEVTRDRDGDWAATLRTGDE
jgi:transposase-like protein